MSLPKYRVLLTWRVVWRPVKRVSQQTQDQRDGEDGKEDGRHAALGADGEDAVEDAGGMLRAALVTAS